jgi:hypothetical protein
VVVSGASMIKNPDEYGQRTDPETTEETNFWLDPYGNLFVADYYDHDAAIEYMVEIGILYPEEADDLSDWIRISSNYPSERGAAIYWTVVDDKAQVTQRQLDTLFDLARFTPHKSYGESLMEQVNALCADVGRLKSNPAPAPLVLIGVQQRRELGDDVMPAMEGFPETAPLVAELFADNFEIYDMSTRPEMGDALDAITAETPLVVAVHLWGIDVSGVDEHVLTPSYHYNRRNAQLLPLTQELGVPLLVIGDQPVSQPWSPERSGKPRLYNVPREGRIASEVGYVQNPEEADEPYHSVKFVYYDQGELAKDLDEVVLTVGGTPEQIAYGIEWQYGPRNIHAVIEEEADEEIDEVVALRVHNIEAQPGGLFGIDYGYEMEAWWVPWEDEA